MSEIHSCLINTLIRDLQAGAEPVRALASTSTSTEDQPDSDYWEGLKGATTETLRPIATDLASTWSTKVISPKDRKGWESALVGLLWERGSLASLPTYLDNILHLTFEDKPAPTRPTWSTGPSTSGGAGGGGGVPGLVPSKPEKRWGTLHHTHKLDIIGWVIEMVVQTGAVRDFMEESTAALTEVRKEQIDVKREWKRM
jgi:bromodomain adjacent to zinc finger domain protein 1A